jgi:hypothetical protein
MAPTLEAILGNDIVGEVLRVNKEVNEFTTKYLDMGVSDDDLIKEYQDIFVSMAALGETSIEDARNIISPRFIEMVTSQAEEAIRKNRGAVRGSPSIESNALAMAELAKAYQGLIAGPLTFIDKAYQEAAKQLEMDQDELKERVEYHLRSLDISTVGSPVTAEPGVESDTVGQPEEPITA